MKRHCLLEKHTYPKLKKTNDKSSRSLLNQTTFDNKEDAKEHIVQSQCNLKCDICGKQFGLAQHLKRHKQIHDNNDKSS